MQGLRIGHFTQTEHGTGASVFLFDKPALGAYYLCGSSPASHEIACLDLAANVTHLNGLGLFGGSAFGLNAVAGMMRWLNEQNRGWKVPHGVVPIVPAAAIYDLSVKAALPPTPDDAYSACGAATEDNRDSGRIGAGTGASVGKLVPGTKRMTGGLGRAEITLENGASVIVYAVVNAVGDIRDISGKIIAGGRDDNDEIVNGEAWLLEGNAERRLGQSANTTLIAIFTNAKFSKVELYRIAKMATAGMARAITPAFTRYEGDIIFAVSLGEIEALELVIGASATSLTQHAIMNAVQDSVVL